MESGARIDGRLIYESPEEYPIRGQVGRGVTWTPREAEPVPGQRTPLEAILDVIRRIATIGLIGLLLNGAAPRGLRSLADAITIEPLPSLGWGAVGLAVMVGSILAVGFLTLLLALGFGVATLASLAGVAVILGIAAEAVLAAIAVVYFGLVAQAVISYTAGRWILQQARSQAAESGALPLVIGVPLYVLLTELPILGGILSFVSVLLAVGALWVATRTLRLSRRVDPLPGDTRGPAPQPAG
jgi:hypothetical protein